MTQPTNGLSSANQHLNADAKQSAVYRPKYRLWTKTPTHELEQAQKRLQESPLDTNLFQSIEQVHQWRASDERRSESNSRWHPNKLGHIKVYVQPAPQADWNQCVWSACQEWVASSAGKIHFVQTVQPEHADIAINWIDHATPGRPFEVGHTDKKTVAPGWIIHAKISLLQTPVIDNHISSKQRLERIYTTLLHELGHALGLEHSTSNKDVMHHQGWQNKHLSQNDTDRLQQLYKGNTHPNFTV